MLFSVFTPTHDPKWLLDAYYSLTEQTYSKWEWIIVPNGENRNEIIHKLSHGSLKKLSEDERVRVQPVDWENAGIGKLKAYACNCARGDMLVELDHDDMLLPDCLEELYQRYQATRAGFIHSDCVMFYPSHMSEVYVDRFGWQPYHFKWRGRDYQIMKMFPINARSLCEIFYAPNHVRAWHTSAYRKIGGHDISLKIADDHDLVCRTYLAGVRMEHVEKPLYAYRRHPHNTCFIEQDTVYENQLRNMNTHLHPLIFEWCKREKLDMIDLGGAHNCPKELGFRALDLQNAEIIADATKELPFEDNSVGCFRAFDFLEHVPIPEVVPFMNRLYRKLAPGGWFISGTPSVSGPEGEAGRGAFQDPTHVSFWSQNNFWYYTNRDFSNYVEGIDCRFQAVRVWTDWPSEWHHRMFIPYVFADLWALKGQPQIGSVDI